MRYLTTITLLTAIAALVGCAQEQNAATATSDPVASTVAAINEHCPIMGGEVTTDGGRVEWNGQTVGFCCPECIEKFEALSADEKAAALAKAEAEHTGHDHGDHDHDTHNGETTEAS